MTQFGGYDMSDVLERMEDDLMWNDDEFEEIFQGVVKRKPGAEMKMIRKLHYIIQTLWGDTLDQHDKAGTIRHVNNRALVWHNAGRRKSMLGNYLPHKFQKEIRCHWLDI